MAEEEHACYHVSYRRVAMTRNQKWVDFRTVSTLGGLFVFLINYPRVIPIGRNGWQHIWLRNKPVNKG